MRKFLFIIVLMIIPVTTVLYSETIWKEINLYSSASNLKNGDIIVVNVIDISDLKFDFGLQNKGTSSVSSNKPAAPKTGEAEKKEGAPAPKEEGKQKPPEKTSAAEKVNTSSSYSSTDTTQFTEKRNFTVSIASRVVKKTPEGFFQIQGTRNYLFNGVTNRINISGLLDPALLRGRTIDSKYLAEFRVEVRVITQ
ncbi:MAG: flagellar basal body L-ring protein FlgH [bacterium]|nr:flagellar basal body L-ring protein FlgH [bacterium]